MAIPGSSVSVHAASSTCTLNHEFIGADSNYFTMYGAGSNMNTDAAKQVCDNVSVSPMLTNSATNQNDDWAQIGLIQLNGQSSQYLFYEWATSAAPGPIEEFSGAPGGTYAYAVTYDGSNQTYYFYFDGKVQKTISDIGWSPNWTQFYGEVHANQDYVPGSSSNPEKETNVEYFQSGSWHNFSSSQPLYYSNGTPYGKFSSQGTYSFGIYDSRA